MQPGEGPHQNLPDGAGTGIFDFQPPAVRTEFLLYIIQSAQPRTLCHSSQNGLAQLPSVSVVSEAQDWAFVLVCKAFKVQKKEKESGSTRLSSAHLD